MTSRTPGCYAEVVPEVAVRRLRAPLTYAVPEDLAGGVQLGARVLIPLRGRRVTGVVVGLRDHAEAPEIRPILAVVEGEPAFDESLLELARWIAGTYFAPLQEALHAVVPPEMEVRYSERVRIGTARQALEDVRRELSKARAIRQLRVLDLVARAREIEIPALRRATGFDDLREILRALERRGVLQVLPAIMPPKARPRKEVWVRLVIPDTAAREIAGELKGSAPRQARALEVLGERTSLPRSELARIARTDGKTIERLREKGLVAVEEREISYHPIGAELSLPEPSPPPVPLVALNPDQQGALYAIGESVAKGRGDRFLLFGTVESGKTEVCLQAIDLARRSGRRSIVLVPEISLTPQLAERFRRILGDRVAVFHSGLSAGERYTQWRRIRAGEVDVVVGARSAVFAAVPDLGLVVVDEEHDPSYKQEKSPRYHAREVALARGRISGATVVLASSTPSVESFYRAQQGELRLLFLPTKITGTPFPEVSVVDLRGTAVGRREWILSGLLQDAIEESLRRGEQAILYVNRRGYATSLLCHECGHVLQCPRCGVAVAYHAGSSPRGQGEEGTGTHSGNASRRRVLRCHTCNLSLPAPASCPRCGGFHLRLLGVGTQRVEREVRSRFPTSRVARVDRDTVSSASGLQAIREAFHRGEIQILVGTQMILGIPGLTGASVVAMISLDQDLGLPDFRAAERAFQHLMQLARKVGKEGLPGRVVIQTYNPQHFVVEAARTLDYEWFYREEIRLRQILRYPPFVRLINLVVTHPSGEVAGEVAGRLAARLRGDGLEALGPAPAPIPRIRGQSRWQILCKVAEPQAVKPLVEAAVEGEKWPAGTRISVDVDPMEML